MRFVSAQTLQAWLSSWKGGATQPCIRATIDPFLLETVPYDASQIGTVYTTNAAGATVLRAKPRNVRGNFAIGMFNPGRTPKELPNIRTVKYDTSIDADAATMTMELWNTTPLPIGQEPADDYTFDLPGYFSPGRGAANEPAEWGNTQNEWQGMLAPDRLIRLYAGYGWDSTVTPEKDPHLYPAGLWLIDEVTFNDKGVITVTCRDLARLLMEQICMPPVISADEYPISWTTYGTGTTSSLSTVAQQAIAAATTPVTTPTTTATFGWSRPVYATSSNDKYIGKSITDNLGRPVIAADGNVSGHYGRHAFDADVNSYWLSVGAIYATVPRFVEGTFVTAQDVGAVRIKTWGGPYNVWISLQINGIWQGSTKIPYTAGQDYIVTDAVIPYVKWATVGANATTDIGVPVNTDGSPRFKSVTRIRVTFTALKPYGTGNTNLHAGAYDIQVSSTPTSSIPQTPIGGVTGATPTSQSLVTVSPENMGDITDPVTWFAAWAGFYWAGGSSAHNTLTYADGTTDVIAGPPVGNPILPPSGRIWGDIEEAGTSPIAPLAISQFDKKPLLDGVSLIRDILGYICYIDELGGFVFRSPNIWEVGNFVYPVRVTDSGNGPANLGRTPDIIDLKDDETILAISTTLSSHNTREKVIVGDVTGALGATAILKPNNKVGPFESNMRRQSVWCVDEETEIFTRRGWLRYDQVKAGDETLSIDESTGLSIWQPVTKVNIFPAEERKLWKAETESFSALTTGDHRWYVENYQNWTGKRVWRWRTSETMTNMDSIPRAVDHAQLPTSPSISDEMVELVAWAFADSGWVSVRDSFRLTISQSERANGESCQDINRALWKVFGAEFDGLRIPHIGVAWKRYDRPNDMSYWSLSWDASQEILEHFGGDRCPSMDFYTSLTQEQLELFLNTCIKADGTERLTSTHSKTPTRFFYQELGARSDSFMSACALAGVAVSYHVRNPDDVKNHFSKRAKVSITLRKTRRMAPCVRPQREPEWVDHSGIVWCPSVEKNHTWLARRKNSVYYTGNTDQSWGTAKECLVTAELIMLRQSFTYRTTKITIPANPAIQIDDQVRVWDRMSATTYLYYVSGISSNFDMRSGKWTYDLTAHWLGTDPFTEWAFAAGDLSTDTRTQLGPKIPTTPTTGTGTTTTGTPAAANYGWFHTDTTYTVDTIAARFGISSTAIHTLNPKLGTVVGSKYWVKIRTNYGPITTAHETVYAPYGWFQSLSNSNTVATVAGVYGITANSLRSMNQWLVGNTITVGQWVQVRTTADQPRTS